MNRKVLALFCLASAATGVWHAVGSSAAVAKPAAFAKPAPGTHPSKAAHAPSNSPAAASKPVTPNTRVHDIVPDSTVLARVDDRIVRVKEFIESYFDSDPEYRTHQDSLGRVDFLNSMVNKELLAAVALATNKPLTFEDRATLREHTNRVISNVLYEKLVIDSVNVTEADILESYEQFKYEVHLKHIQTADRATAEQARRDLAQHRLPWGVAVRKYSVAPDKERDGDMGWRSRLGMDGQLASQVFTLKPGELSQVIDESEGHHIVIVTERRPAVAPSLEPMRRMIRDQLVSVRSAAITSRIQKSLLSKVDVVYDEANIAWAATKFTKPVTMQNQAGGPVIDINPNLPDVEAADHDRVLARYKGGQVTVDQLMKAYEAMPALMRPAMDTAPVVKEQVDGVILEPTMIQLAFDRGLDKDPESVPLIRKKLEQIMVEHLYQDSIQAHVRVTPEMRHKYYDNNRAGFVTYPKVRFAAISEHSKSAADSMKARLLRGEKAEAILLADSLAGVKRGTVQERYQNEHGPFQKVLFEELRPGQMSVDGPDKSGDFIVLQLLAFDPGHQLKYEEVERVIDESVQNINADEQLKELIARHRSHYHVETHPELLMRFELKSKD